MLNKIPHSPCLSARPPQLEPASRGHVIACIVGSARAQTRSFMNADVAEDRHQWLGCHARVFTKLSTRVPDVLLRTIFVCCQEGLNHRLNQFNTTIPCKGLEASNPNAI